ncbi:MAG: hypothetical protein KatS3mg131_2179 [Candidatus Tectimicrobiota bacterium]|nr:MAG: hypothetical protein KatS3mg131_2179 [Candidatus Tectomicrobia bacterium]
MALRRQWGWSVAALLYERAYVRVAHQTDSDLLAYLGARVVGATVADCGCGPGVVSEKFLRAGAARVVAIDANRRMLARARRRLAKAVASGQVLLYHGSYDALPAVQRQVLGGRGFDLVLFKRSLYMSPPRALRTLRQAAAAVRPQGVLLVVHPERALRRYAFAPPWGVTSYTLFHLLNRGLSRLAASCGAEEYTLYTQAELLALLRTALPAAHVVLVPTRQRPYNLAAVHLP